MPENPSEKGMSSNDLITFADVKGSESKSKMENLDQSSLEEKVDLGNLELFPPDSYISEEIEEENFRIQDKSSENNIDNDTSDVKEEIIEVPGYEYEKEPIEFSSHSNEMCQICGLEFGNKAVLKIHYSLVHPEGRQSDQNGIRIENNGVFSSVISKNQVVNSHSSPFHEEGKKNMLFKCDLCSLSYTSKITLRFHTESSHKQKTVLETYIESLHEKIKLFKCNICEYRAVLHSTLKKHIEFVHDGIKPSKIFKCTFCDYETVNSSDLKKHTESVHEGIKLFNCIICDFKTSRNENLKIHIKSVHEGIKPFSCNICGYKTTQKVHLKKHIESVHEKIKPFSCNNCEYKAAQRSTLKNHIESVHEGIARIKPTKKFKCKICDYETVNSSNLNRHTKSVHKGIKNLGL